MANLWRDLLGKPDSWTGTERSVETSFRILLLRAPDETERRERVRVLEVGKSSDELNRSLLGSAEFREIYEGYAGSSGLGRKAQRVEEELSLVGDDTTFIAVAYRCLLGRDADDAGRTHYIARLSQGALRLSVVKALIATEYLLEGPVTDETFPPDEIRALAERPGLKLIEPLDERVQERYRIEPVDLRTNPYQTPQMVVRNGETVFTSVMLFLERV